MKYVGRTAWIGLALGAATFFGWGSPAGIEPVAPAADLIGAVYTRPDGTTTAAMSLPSGEAERLYGRLTRPTPGRDPLCVDRPTRSALDVRIFPVPPGASIRLVLSFVTPLSG